MGQPLNSPAPNEPADEGFCPACGEPTKDGKINHDSLCPFLGDELPPEIAHT